MKNVLVFGDSNSWGYVPQSDKERYPTDVRWPGVMQSNLGTGYRVTESALNGRTTCFDDPIQDNRNGRTVLPVALESHAPLDIVIIMLGTNDLKIQFNLTPHSIALAAGALVETVLASDAGPGNSAPAVVLVSPVHVVETETPFGHKFDGAIEKSHGLAGAYQEIAGELGCLYFDAASVATASPDDGVHLDVEGHHSLGVALAGFVQTGFPSE